MIDFNKINELYGIDVLKDIKTNEHDVIKNLMYFAILGFDDTIDIFERKALVFIDDNISFKSKIDKLIDKIGINYVDEIENNIDLLDLVY